MPCGAIDQLQTQTQLEFLDSACQRRLCDAQFVSGLIEGTGYSSNGIVTCIGDLMIDSGAAAAKLAELTRPLD